MEDTNEDIQEMLEERRSRLDEIETEINRLATEETAVNDEIATLEQRLRERGIEPSGDGGGDG